MKWKILHKVPQNKITFHKIIAISRRYKHKIQVFVNNIHNGKSTVIWTALLFTVLSDQSNGTKNQTSKSRETISEMPKKYIMWYRLRHLGNLKDTLNPRQTDSRKKRSNYLKKESNYLKKESNYLKKESNYLKRSQAISKRSQTISKRNQTISKRSQAI
jgi:hypothetical protein